MLAAYANYKDVENGFRELSPSERTACAALLNEAAMIIDALTQDASSDAKRIVSVRMVRRVIGSIDAEIPMGASQGSVSALGYSQSWTMPTAASTGELYLTKLDKRLLGIAGGRIGSYSPVQDMEGEI